MHSAARCAAPPLGRSCAAACCQFFKTQAFRCGDKASPRPPPPRPPPPTPWGGAARHLGYLAHLSDMAIRYTHIPLIQQLIHLWLCSLVSSPHTHDLCTSPRDLHIWSALKQNRSYRSIVPEGPHIHRRPHPARIAHPGGVRPACPSGERLLPPPPALPPLLALLLVHHHPTATPQLRPPCLRRWLAVAMLLGEGEHSRSSPHAGSPYRGEAAAATP